MEALGAVEALIRLGGIADSPSVVALSSRKRVRTALDNHQIIRVARNRLALPTAERGLEAAKAVGGYVSHLTAAAHHGWAIKAPADFPQVIVARGRTVPPHQLIEVRQRVLPAGDRAGWATSPLRTVVDCAADLPFDVALCVADSALRAGAIDVAELAARADRIRGTKGERVRRVAAHADPRAANPFESALRAPTIVIGLEFVPQYAVTVNGVEYHPDLANPVLGLILEADSYAFHGRTARHHNRDVVRYNAFVAAGWAMLRFTWEQVMLEPQYVLRTLRAWLAEAA